MDEQSQLSLQQEIENANDVISKLHKFTEELQKTCSENILTHLCDGLEKFLGYDVNSKGYTGQGIVYSDLDRLCDGVMGFLSGVLNEVKNDPSVTTYYNKMETTLKKIKESMHTPGGLSTAVGAVSGALGAWDREVTAKTNALKNALDYIKTNKFNDFNSVLSSLNYILPKQLDNVAEWLGTCIVEASYLSNAFDDAEQEYEKLDKNLKDKLTNHVNNINVQVKQFTAAAANVELRGLLAEGEKHLSGFRNAIKTEIHRRIIMMGNKINDEFNKQIIHPINEVNKKLTESKDALNAWINHVENKLAEAMRMIQKIVGKVNGIPQKDNGERQALLDAADNLHGYAMEYHFAVSSAKGHIENLVPKAIDVVAELDVELKKDLFNVKEKIRCQLERYVDNALLHFVEIKNKTLGTDGGGNNDGMLFDWKELRREIKGLVDKVAKSKATPGILDAILEGFQHYAELFVQNIRRDMEGMASSIVRGNEGINMFIDWYIEDNKGSFTKTGVIEQAKRDAIVTTLQGYVPYMVHHIVKEAADAAELTTSTDLKKLAGNFVRFENKLEKMVRNGFDTQDVGSIVQAVAQQLQTDSVISAPTSRNENLKSAVAIISKSLAVVVMHAAKEIKSLIDMSKIGKLDDAMQSVGGIKEQLDNGHGAPITEALDNIHDRINKLESVLNKENFIKELTKQLPGQSESKVSIKRAPTFHGYCRYINQNGGQEGKLKTAIQKIKTEVNQAFDSLANRHILDQAKDKINDNFRIFCVEVKKLLDEVSIDTTDRVHQQPQSDGLMQMLQELRTAISDETNKVSIKLRDSSVKGDGLEKIKIDLEKILGTAKESNKHNLSTIIASANFFKTVVIDKEAENAINEITKFVTNEVHDATQAIRTQAKESYYNRIHPMFQSMRTEVTSQIAAIEREIANDLNSGVKGLLRKVMDHDRKDEGDDTNMLKKLNQKNSDSNVDCRKLSDEFKKYVESVIFFVGYQLAGPHPGEPGKKVDAIKSNILALLKHLTTPRIYHYDHQFANLLSALSSFLASLHPSAFANPRHPELLDAVRKGLQGFVQEMGRVYVNGYDGHKERIRLDHLVENNVTNDEKLSDAGRNLSRVFLTILPMLSEDLTELNDKCRGEWKTEFLCEMRGKEKNPLGNFLKRCGFRVAERDTSKDGELRLPLSGFSGKEITKLPLFTSHSSGDASKFLVTLESLITHLNLYNQVGHLRHVKSPRNPCSIFEMLVWSYGLQHNAVYAKLVEHCNKYDTSYNKQEDKDFKRRLDDTVDLSVSALCSHSRNILATILGAGDEYTTYAVDYSDNSLNLKYPASGEDCLHTLLDILRRLLPTLRFLNNQCKLTIKHHGWYDCEYGMTTAPAKWPCTAHSSEKATSQPNTQPKCQPTCKVNSRANCQPTSPLQSYLNDCLPGHLPHKLIDVGCKSECKTCSPSTSGMPCLTPLGFKAFSCSTRRGKDICAVLSRFFTAAMLTPLFCLAPKPPSTLPEYFGFTLSLIQRLEISDNAKSGDAVTVQKAFTTSITEQSIMLYTEKSDLTEALKKAYGSPYPEHGQCTDAHLRNLTAYDSCKQKTNRDLECAPYLSTLCRDSYYYLTAKHANLYLSWAIYLPWNFWTLLQKLYDAFCSINCQDWGCRGCLRADICKKGSHGVLDKNTTTETCNCNSIVTCKGVLSTFYRCGFRFGSAEKLNYTDSPNTCSDFCTQLDYILNSQYFKNLFKECDNFLYYIRFPFMTLTLALWLLSLLYLIHIMVIRLDLLHIKSHLHSPSSHRIAAQSLLAATRVNKLNRVFYLQP